MVVLDSRNGDTPGEQTQSLQTLKRRTDMKLSTGSALVAALILLLVIMAIVCWITETIQKWHDKRHPKPKKKPLSINDPRQRRTYL